MRPTIFHQPLRKTVPAIENVLRDPAEALKTDPLVIRDQPAKMLLLLCVGAGIIWWFPASGPTVIFGRILYAVIAVVIPFNLIFRRRKIVLDGQGIEYAFGRKSVFVPWAVVDRYASSVSHADVDLKLPVLPACLDAIEHRRDGVGVAYGTGARSLWVKVSADGLVSLRAPYGVSPAELGGLIMRLSRSEIVTPAQSSIGPPAARAPAVCRRLSEREVDVLLTHLDFPPMCCECERPTDIRMQLTFRQQAEQWPYPTFAPGAGPRREALVAAVPYCPECQSHSRRRGWARTAMLAALLGLPIWGLFLALWLNGDLSANAVPVMGVVAILWTVAGLAGCAMAGFSLWAWPAVQGQLPLERQVVRLRFRRPSYADRLAEWLAGRPRSTSRTAWTADHNQP